MYLLVVTVCQGLCCFFWVYHLIFGLLQSREGYRTIFYSEAWRDLKSLSRDHNQKVSGMGFH